MPIYHYLAYARDGRQIRGTRDAATESELRQFLREQQLYPREIKTKRLSAKSPKVDWRKFLPERTNYAKQLTMFTRQLETLLTVTIPYDKALEMIIAQTSDQTFRSVLSEVRGRVLEGDNLAAAMQRHPRVFPLMFTSMVRSGESAGNLDQIMKRLADYYEAQEKLKSKLRSAMIYPCFMLVFGFAVVGFMMTYIVPKITAIFESREANLPISTQILIGVSNVVSQYWYLILILIAATSLGLAYYFQTESGQRFKDRSALKLPGIKVLTTKVMVLRFCQTLGTLLQSGVDLKGALEIAKHVVANSYFTADLEQLIINVNNKGVPLSAAMKKIEYFPEYVIQVVAIGEQAAKLDELLQQTADRMQLEVSNTVEGLTALLQPIMILVMGILVGFIAVSILMPMLNFSQLLGV